MMNEHEEDAEAAELVDIPAEIETLARHMEAVADRITYYAGMNSELVAHARELTGAAGIARGWAVGMREENDFPPVE